MSSQPPMIDDTKKKAGKQQMISPPKGRQLPGVRSIGAVIAVVILSILALLLPEDLRDELLSALQNIEPSPAPTRVFVTPVPRVGEVVEIPLDKGVGFSQDFWQVYFNQPDGNSDRSTYVGGIDVALASAIDEAQVSVDIAVFEMNSRLITDALLNAHQRGVQVRVVTDDEHGIDDFDSTLVELDGAGIPIVDDDKTALMHNKFVVIDNASVWTGSMNFTQNGTYRNDNNLIMLRAQRVVQAYQAEFNEMFERGEFGPRSDPSNAANFSHDGTPVRILFASEGNASEILVETVLRASSEIRFMTFVFSSDSIAEAMLQRASQGVQVRGIFENRNSTASWSHLPTLLCAGLDVRQDSNPFTLHHKVILVDDDTVITGSFNFSGSASRNNDENVIILQNREIASLYIQEWERLWQVSRVPNREQVVCQ